MNKDLFVKPKFKIQAVPKQDKAWVCVWYIDARDCQDILDKAFWPDKRQNEYYEVRGKTFCKVWVKINERVRKSDSWALSENESVDNDVTSKGDTSDSFKRACVMRWIGRYLYTLPKIWIKHDEYQANKRKINERVNEKYKKELKEWYDNLFGIIQEKPTFWEKELEALKAKRDEYKEKHPTPETLIQKMQEKYIVDPLLIKSLYA